MELVSESLTTPGCDDNVICTYTVCICVDHVHDFFYRILSFQRMSVSLLVVLILQAIWLLKCTMTTLLEYKVRMLQQHYSNGMVLAIWHCCVFINQTVRCSTHTDMHKYLV